MRTARWVSVRQVSAVRASISVRPVLNGRGSLCADERSKSVKARAAIGTLRFAARGVAGREARPSSSPEMNVPEPRRL
jgi:hypothetical protein